MTLDDILSKWRAEMASAEYAKQKAAGDAFERLCIVYLTHDPEQKIQYRRVMAYKEWAKERGKDTDDIGIDLVAETIDGHFAAVQCKFYAQGKTIAKKDIDSFIAASATHDFTQRIFIDTTGRSWSDKVEKELHDLAISVVRIGLHKLRNSPINWDKFVTADEIHYEHKPLVLRPHQQDALNNVVKGLQETGSRGKLIMACGTGKTLTALRIAEQMVGNGGRVLYLVPSLALMSQTIHAWTIDAKLTLRAFAICSDSQVGKRKKSQDDNIDMDVLDLAWPATTDASKLAEQAKLDDSETLTIFFATYQSSPVIERAQKEFGLPDFDLAICDEAHRTAGAIIDQEGQSNFTRIHDDSCIHASRRLYMTATPKVYSETARDKAGKLDAVLCSMDDVKLYGPVLYEIGFAAAVEQDLLSDYRVIVLTVPENLAAQVLAHFGGEFGESLKADDTALMIGCWRALAKADSDIFPENERQPMKRAIAFCRTIETSQQLKELIQKIGQKYRALESDGDQSLPSHDAPAKHIDGTHNAEQRAEKLKWLDSPEENECRILTNARCLTEGVDLPALDGILFMHPRKSQIEVVQAVGRVMRKTPDKQMGYIILPVVVTPGTSAQEMLDDNERWRKVWQMLNAIRSHDEGFDAELNRIEMGEDPKRLSIVTMSDWQPRTGESEPQPIIDPPPVTPPITPPSPNPSLQADILETLPGAIMAKIVEKCGSRKYWDEWAGDVAKIARAHIARITAMVTVDEMNQDNPDIQVAVEMFDGFVKELQDDLNSGITRENAIEMLAQHMVTGPVFDALFEAEAFTRRNPVSQAMQNMLDVIKPSGIEAEAENLEEFYASVKRRAKGAASDEAKQQIIAELYDKFFRNAFAETSKALGIVYTPVEVVDFILQSTEQVLNDELGASLSNQGVNILDPFTGTGTFITRLLQSGLIKDADLERKFDHEIHANEIVLLAYYIAAVNIESVFHAKTGREYQSFKHICLADTFRMNEKGPAQESMVKDSLKENSERRSGQKDLEIRVIVGNPPWMAGQKEHGYPELYKKVEETYVSRSTATNKNSLYDSYKLAIRWASDRIGDRGVIGFVTNGSWISGNVDSGIRACLAEEFTSVYIVDLRGNARTSGELRKTEGDNVFGLGSRAPVAIMMLVKNPQASHQGCRIFYRDIGDYLSREEKIEQLVEWQSITGIDDWKEIQPDQNYDWINKREEGFDELLPLGSKKVKAGKADDTVFHLYSNGYKTARDAYLYNFSLDSCDENAQLMIDDYKAALEALSDSPTANEVELVSRRFAKNIHWERELKNNLTRRKKVDFSSGHIWKIQYRPFVKQYCYVDYTLVSNKYQQNLIFPEVETENRAICLPGIGSSQPFSALMVDRMPDLGINSATQCFPRYRYEKPDESNQNQESISTTENCGERIDNITDFALNKFKSHYQDAKITKDDIFDYVYGVLHAPDFREAFPNALSKELARIPMASDFRGFADAGHVLGDLHIGYEYCPEYSLELEFAGNGEAEPRHFKLGTKVMKYGKINKEVDKSTLIVNEYIHLTGIPDEAHEYMVNGRTPLDWLIDRYKITTDKKSGKANDPNAQFEKPEDLISTIRRIVHLSVETTRIVRSLPKALPKYDSK